MANQHNSPNMLSTVYKRRKRADIAYRRSVIRERVSAWREDDFARRRTLAAILQVLGDPSEFLIENYCVTADALKHYENVLRYRSDDMTIEWVGRYLDRLSYYELQNWVETRFQIVDHMEHEAGFPDTMPRSPYTDSWSRLKLEISHLPFLFDSDVVNTTPEHPDDWFLDTEAAIWKYPPIFNRFSKTLQSEILPHLKEKLCGPWPYKPDPHRVRPEEIGSYVGQDKIEKMVAQDQERITTAVMKQHDKMYGTNFIPKKSFGDHLVALLISLFTFRHHEQRND